MSKHIQVGELLDRLEVLRERGVEISLEELCRDCPEVLDELKQRIDDLKIVEAALDTPHSLVDTVDDGSGGNGPIRAGRFRLIDPEKPIGEGGLGKVYNAQDSELGRTVAVKCMKRWDQDPQGRRRFVLEARLTARLEHPGVVPVYGMGEDRDDLPPYYAMRKVNGATLATTLSELHDQTNEVWKSPQWLLDLRRLLQNFIAVCETVAYAHDRGVIHRDIKPANIMLGPYGETLLLDWGLAKSGGQTEAPEGNAEDSLQRAFADPEGRTIQGTVKGSPAYMSPEQASGEWDRVGPASDIYSLGATLYVVLTGKRPFDGSHKEVLQNVKAGNFAAPRQVQPLVSRALDAVCLKAMAPQPEVRYANAKELAKDLERWLADAPVSCCREPVSIRARRWLKAHRTAVVAGATTIVVAMALLTAFALRLTVEKQKLESANRALTVAIANATTAREEAERNLQRAVDQIFETTDRLHSSELELYRNHPVYVIMSDVFFQQLDRLANETSAGNIGDALRCQRELQRMHRMSVSNPNGFPAELQQQLASTRALLENYSVQHPAEVWPRLNVAKTYLLEAVRLELTGRPVESRATLQRAFDIFVKCATPDTSLGRHAIVCVAVTAGMLSASPSDAANDPDAIARIDIALDLLAGANKTLGEDANGLESFLVRIHRSQLLAAKATRMLKEQKTPQEARGVARESLDVVETIRDDWSSHPLFFKTRGSAAVTLGNVSLKEKMTLDGWNLLQQGTGDIITFLQAIPGELPEFERRFGMFTTLGLALAGGELASTLTAKTPADRETIQHVVKISVEALDFCERLEQLVPESQRDPKAANTIQDLRGKLSRYLVN